MSAGVFSTRVLISKEVSTRESDVVLVRRFGTEEVHEFGKDMLDVPVGGTTRDCHESTDAIGEAARYLAVVAPEHRPRPLVPALRDMFGLSSAEACQAITESHRLREVAP